VYKSLPFLRFFLTAWWWRLCDGTKHVAVLQWKWTVVLEGKSVYLSTSISFIGHKLAYFPQSCPEYYGNYGLLKSSIFNVQTT